MLALALFPTILRAHARCKGFRMDVGVFSFEYPSKDTPWP